MVNSKAILSKIKGSLKIIDEKNTFVSDKKTQTLIFNISIVRWTAVLIYFVNVFINYFLDTTYSFFVCAISFILMLGSILAIKITRYRLNRWLFIIISHASLFTLSQIEGLANGNYNYLFISLVVSIFIFDSKETGKLTIAYSITFITFILTFTCSPMHSTMQLSNVTQEKSTFILNIVFSVLTICSLCIIIFRRNHANEKTLISKEKYLDTVFNTSLDAVLIIDPVTKFVQNCNNESLNIFGTNSSKLLEGKPVNDLFYNIPKALILDQLIEDNTQSWKGELDCVTLSGIIFPGYVSIVSFIDNDKHFKKLSILNISDIKKAQSQMVAAKEKAEEATKAKSVFLSNMSHELRTPLNGIIGITNLMIQDGDTPLKDNNYLEILKYSSEHMLSLINDVLDYSKIEAGKMDIVKESFNMETVLHNLKTFFTPQFIEKNITLDWQTSGNNFDKLFLADKTRITQVLSNLISNALKFTANGYVKLVVNTEKNTEKFAVIKFSVIDTGIGIPKDKREIIFESFGQADTATNRKFGGTGLGLAISKKIVEQYNGKLSITDNEAGVGSDFSFEITLPFDIEASNPKLINTSTEILPPLIGLRALIVEDNQINMLIAKKFLGKWGIQTIEAVNGLNALNVLKENTFDLLLIDLEMPEMDGHQLIKELRKNKILTPAIAFTAAGYENIFNDLLSKGFTDYVQKPFIPEELYNKIKKHSNYAA